MKGQDKGWKLPDDLRIAFFGKWVRAVASGKRLGIWSPVEEGERSMVEQVLEELLEQFREEEMQVRTILSLLVVGELDTGWLNSNAGWSSSVWLRTEIRIWKKAQEHVRRKLRAVADQPKPPLEDDTEPQQARFPEGTKAARA